MILGRVDIFDYKPGVFLYYARYGKRQAGSGLTQTYEYNKQTLVFKTSGLTFKNIGQVVEHEKIDLMASEVLAEEARKHREAV
jgi:hypothetical protein